MFDSIGGGEIMLILIAILVLFGPKRIPDLAQSLGKGLREFRKAQQDLQNNLSSVVNHEDFTKLTQTFNDIKQDMHTSMQTLTGNLNAAAAMPQLSECNLQPAPPALPPAAPATPASETPEASETKPLPPPIAS
jgi:TatA/E family protein of Tat protein translocase